MTVTSCGVAPRSREQWRGPRSREQTQPTPALMERRRIVPALSIASRTRRYESAPPSAGRAGDEPRRRGEERVRANEHDQRLRLWRDAGSCLHREQGTRTLRHLQGEHRTMARCPDGRRTVFARTDFGPLWTPLRTPLIIRTTLIYSDHTHNSQFVKRRPDRAQFRYRVSHRRWQALASQKTQPQTWELKKTETCPDAG